VRVCLVSDTHRFRHELFIAVKAVQPVAAVLHAGDEATDAAWLAERIQCPVYGVSGNWDTPTELYPGERVLELSGVPIYLTHGHQLHVKDGLEALADRARALGVNVVIFGHTHAAMAVQRDDIVFINPGSLAAPRGRRERTFALLDIESCGALEYILRVAHCTTAGMSLADLILTARISRGAQRS